MFNLHDYIMKMLHGMVGNYPDWQIMEYAINWYSKSKLTEEDLAEVEAWFVPEVEEPVEETPTDTVEEPVEQTETSEEPVEEPTPDPVEEYAEEPVEGTVEETPTDTVEETPTGEE